MGSRALAVAIAIVAFSHAIRAEDAVRWISDIREDSLAGPGLFSRIVNVFAGGADHDRLTLPFDVCMSADHYLVLVRGTNELVAIERASLKARVVECTHDALIGPVAVTGSPDDFYISDPEQGTVFHGQGGALRVFADETAGLVRPTGLALDRDGGRLWVVDTGRHRIVCFTLNGEVLVELGSRGEADEGFNFPTFMAIDSDGALIINDTMNGQIKKFTAEGTFLWSIGGLDSENYVFERAKGVTTDDRGRIYVVDNLSDQIFVLSPDGALIDTIGVTGSGAGELWSPVGICARGDTLVVADTQNHRLALFGIESAGQR